VTIRALLFADGTALGDLVESALLRHGCAILARDPRAARTALEAQPSPCLIAVAADSAAAPALSLRKAAT
jgi:hypothetical protein